MGARIFLEVTGLEGDCAEQSEVKTSQCDVFKESADDIFSHSK
jgi:hypothetical protein